MSIKMIVCDMDGTLLDSENEIQPKTYKKLMEFQKQGIIVVLASGRSYLRLLPDAQKLHMDKYNGFLIDVNGSSIYDVVAEKRQRIGLLEKENINELNKFFNAFNVELQYYQDDTMYTYLTDSIYELKKNIRGEMRVPEDFPWVCGAHSWLADYRDGYPTQIMIRELDQSPDYCNKMMIAQGPYYQNFVREVIYKSEISENYEFVSPDERRVEVTKKGITKGNTLDLLLNKLNIHKDEVIVFGDSENDISMFSGKKYTVAMGNGLQNAKDSAKFLTNTNNNEGIYNMLVKFEKEGIL